MSNNLIGYCVQLLLVVGLMMGVYALIRPSLQRLLDQLLKLSAGTEFYMRALLLLLLSAGLQKAVGDSWKHKPDAAFMEYVWDIGETLGVALELAFWFIMIYVALMTILTATLRRGQTS